MKSWSTEDEKKKSKGTDRQKFSFVSFVLHHHCLKETLFHSLSHTHSLFVVAFSFLILKRSLQNHNRSLLLSLALQNSLFFAAFSILFFFFAFISSLPHPPGDDWGQRHRRWETNRTRRFVRRVRNRYRTNFL
jgi:hypothetical protein